VAHLLGAEAIHLEYPSRVVFESTTIGVSDGDRIGIVGRNGDGKSSLLDLLTGQLRPDAGRVTQRSGLRVGALSQADILDSDSTVGWTLVADRADHEWAGDPRIRDVVNGLVSDIAWNAVIGTLSGGQRRRVQLAALLIGEWDVIALDEPTNHLDIDPSGPALGPQHRRPAAGDPRPLVPRRSRHDDVGSARRTRGAVRGRIRRLHLAARRAGSAGRCR
jgi:ATPase subunit of ABC transporter with duplicated ATPase domains